MRIDQLVMSISNRKVYVSFNRIKVGEEISKIDFKEKC